MYYAVIDEEFCRVPHSAKTLGYSLRNEIIQIGIVLLDEEYREQGRFCELVNPQYGKIDSFINSLTGIRQMDVSSVSGLDNIWRKIKRWLPKDSVMVSWSFSDRLQLEMELKEKQIEQDTCSLHDNWIDCQQLFSNLAGTAKQYRLADALNMAAVASEGSTHNALDDAINTAKLFTRIKSPSFRFERYFLTESEETIPLSFSISNLFTNLQLA